VRGLLLHWREAPQRALAGGQGGETEARNRVADPRSRGASGLHGSLRPPGRFLRRRRARGSRCESSWDHGLAVQARR
jgi:hypothetical protein